MRLRLMPAIFAVALTAACTDGGEDITPTEDPTYAGVSPDGSVGIFPHDKYTIEDTTTFTGRRVQFTDAHDPTLAKQRDLTRSMVGQINALDGFGTSAGAWIRFSERIDRSSVVAEENVFIGYMRGEDAVIIPAEALVTDTQVVLRPHVAAPPNHENFFFSTRGILNQDGEEVARSPELAAILAGEGADDALSVRTRAVAQALVAAEIIPSVDELTALGVFTSQSIHEQSLELAEQIQAAGITGTPHQDCTQEANYTLCKFDYTMPDYVGWDQVIDDNAVDTQETYTVTASVFLPRADHQESFEIAYDPEVGHPVTIFGHGLSGSMRDARMIANHACPLGVAVISIDAPQHGIHPRSDGLEELDLMMALFGISIEGVPDVNTRRLRDGWRLSNLDKLALVEALKSDMDFDGDLSTVELDTSRLSYLGGSLGAIQGSEFLALSTDLSGGLLAVGGARISDIVRFGTLFELLMLVLLPRSTQEELDRLYVLLQMGVEVGDGVNWAPYVMQNRLRGDIIPDIAMLSAHPDAIVPSETAIVLARSLGATIVGDAVQPDVMLPVSEGPVSGNHSSGRTVAYLQVDWIWRQNRNEYVAAEHASASDSAEGIAFWLEAYRTLINDGMMRLTNPYPVTGAPPRP